MTLAFRHGEHICMFFIQSNRLMNLGYFIPSSSASNIENKVTVSDRSFKHVLTEYFGLVILEWLTTRKDHVLQTSVYTAESCGHRRKMDPINQMISLNFDLLDNLVLLEIF